MQTLGIVLDDTFEEGQVLKVDCTADAGRGINPAICKFLAKHFADLVFTWLLESAIIPRESDICDQPSCILGPCSPIDRQFPGLIEVHLVMVIWKDAKSSASRGQKYNKPTSYKFPFTR